MWPFLKWPVYPGPVLEPYGMHISMPASSVQRWTYSITASVPGAFQYEGVWHPEILRIQWSVLWNSSMESWVSMEHFSTLPYVMMPQNGIDFLQLFIFFLELRWLDLCSRHYTSLSKSVSQLQITLHPEHMNLQSSLN
jgi:hypothetical protein